MRTLQSYLGGRWVTGTGESRVLKDATTDEDVATLPGLQHDFGEVLHYARSVGGPKLRKHTFHERALMLKALAIHLTEKKGDLYALSSATGCTKTDSWIDIDGGIGVLFTYGSKGRRELPNAPFLVDGPPESFAKDGSFRGFHIQVPRQGAALHINAFNFPVWGMLEKLAPSILAGVPVITKPATPTAFLAEACVREIIAADILPEGALQLICGSVGDIMDHMSGQDMVGFTGSAWTAAKLRSHACVTERSVHFTAEADSLNSSVLAPSSAPGTPEFDLFVREVAREMCTKAGQKCTAIRRAIVPSTMVEDFAKALQARLQKVPVGNPRSEGVKMGPLASRGQTDEVRKAIESLKTNADMVLGASMPELVDARPEVGAFVAPTLFVVQGGAGKRADAPVNTVEAFGPVSSIVPYDGLDEAIDVVRMGGGSLVSSVFARSKDEGRDLVLGMAAFNGRVLVVDEACGRTSTGHGSPLPHLVHGGPGRAGGGEELGGMRGVMHYLQRTAIQGSPDMLTAVTGTWVDGSQRKTDNGHPFRLKFEALDIGDSVVTDSRKISLEDIERFADLSGDQFYAHMDDKAAAANPLFDGRVAHGYFVVSMAAGLFVQPDPGPVLANYGLDRCRFTTPVYPGDVLHVEFTCKQKSLRIDKGYGEVMWDTQVVREDGEVVAAYDVLTLVETIEPAKDA
ncbi:MAG: phenylacetic acid degradation bifunctional protein PaaZ [Myxococcota bacterium]